MNRRSVPAGSAASSVPALLLILGIGIAYALTFRSGHDWGDDFALYIMHARNLAEGLPYAQTGYFYTPFIGPTSYPPMFPLFLWPVYATFGLDFLAFKLLVLAFFLLGLWIVYLLFRDVAGRTLAFLVVLLVGADSYMWGFKDSVMSDIPFFAFVYLALWLSYRLRPDRHPGSDRLLLGLAFGLDWKLEGLWAGVIVGLAV